MNHAYVWHDSFICVTWLSQMCVMTHSDVWHDSLRCVTWLTQTQDNDDDMVLEEGIDSHMYTVQVSVNDLMCEITHQSSHTCNQSCVIFSLHTHVEGVMYTHSHVWKESCILIHVCGRNDVYSFIWTESCILIHMDWVMYTHSHACKESCVLIHICVMSHA